jgi:hypothetical protein
VGWAWDSGENKRKGKGGGGVGISNLSTEITTVLSSAGAKSWCFFVEKRMKENFTKQNLVFPF